MAGVIPSVPLALVNSNSVKLFMITLFYQEALEAQRYLLQNEAKVKGWLNLVIIKEFLLIKV